MEMVANQSAASPSILGLSVFGDPFDPRSWSGSARSLFAGLQAHHHLVGAYSVDLTRRQKLVSAVRHPSANRRRLYLNVMKNRLSFRFRSANANQVLQRPQPHYNTVLQLSALFRPRLPAGTLHCSYHDGNTAVSRRSEFTYVKASSSVLGESWENERQFYPGVDLVFTMSEWVRESMISDFHVRPENVIAVGAGPNLSYIGDLENARGGRPDTGTILFVGVDFEGKGGPTLLRAFRRVRLALPAARLRIVGCSPPLSEPGVEVVGALSKSDPRQEARLRALYEEAAIFALPTQFDCFGIAFVEAMYHGLPCLGSSICAVPEIVRDGETGFTLPPADADAWADKMILLLREPARARALGAAGFRQARQRYSWELVTSRMVSAMSAKLEQRAAAVSAGRV
ncbi:MAG TPA: glycosyltransferase family 4 protein [Terriglobales bacterium]|jgi:glycosyltransferase involved in cell wall biosynthesis